MDEKVSKKGDGSISSFFRNPIVGLLGCIASILGVFLAIYFYSKSTRYRELVYYVNPAKAIIAKSGHTSRLKMLIDNNEINIDITAVQIAIWNQGKESIKKENILKQIKIVSEPPSPIIETSFLKVSRDIVNPMLDNSQYKNAILSLFWEILEKDDGFIVQILYEGDANNKFRINGIIEGQPSIQSLEFPGKIKSPSEQIRSELRMRYILYAVTAAYLIISLFFIILWIKEEKLAKRDLIFLFGSIAMVFVCIYMLLKFKIPEPPFGF
jgi:hypothetical protein